MKSVASFGIDVKPRPALRANAAFSGLSGVTLVVASGPASAVLGTSAPWLLVGIGVGLIGYAAWLLAVAGRDPVPRGEVRLAIAADLAWVVGSVSLVAWGPLAPRGEALVGVVAAVVLGFALLQANAIRRSDRGAG